MSMANSGNMDQYFAEGATVLDYTGYVAPDTARIMVVEIVIIRQQHQRNLHIVDNQAPVLQTFLPTTA